MCLYLIYCEIVTGNGQIGCYFASEGLFLKSGRAGVAAAVDIDALAVYVAI